MLRRVVEVRDRSVVELRDSGVEEEEALYSYLQNRVFPIWYCL